MERLEKIGKVKARASSEIKHSRIGLGFEKLDRNVFDPNKAYDKVAACGVKLARIQSGWQRTEKEKGVYDFAWIDDVVDNLISRGIEPWMCLCYGNELYTEAAKTVFGAVGVPPIFSEEEKLAWANYVKATVRHFEGRVKRFEIWNEPDGNHGWKHGVNGFEYGQFVIDTAKAIREISGNCEILAGVVYKRPLHFLGDAFSVGMGEYIDAVSFHEYTADETLVPERVRALKALAHRFNPNIKIVQGESGSQSKSTGNGALKRGQWTERRQAKQLLRHTIADLFSEVEFTSYFSCMDMIEALKGTVGDVASYSDYGYFGILGADFDENGFSTGEYTPKQSYYALRTICSMFSEDCRAEDLPVIFNPYDSIRVFGKDLCYSDLTSGGFVKGNGSAAFVYWKPENLMTTEYEGTVTLNISHLPDKIRLIDLMTGDVYKIPESMIEKCGVQSYNLINIPVFDYPLAVTFGDFIEI